MRIAPIRLALTASLALPIGACSLLRPPLNAAPPQTWIRFAPLPLSPGKLARVALSTRLRPKLPHITPQPLPLPEQTEKFLLTPGEDVIGAVQVVKVQKGQTLTDIGRRFNLGYTEMTRANPGVNVWIPPVGTRVVLPTQFVLPDAPHRGIVVNLAAMRLFYFPPRTSGHAQAVITHPVGIGRPQFPTPRGITHVISHQKNPVWVVPPSILAEHAKWGAPLPAVVGPGPLDPLGNYALHLGWPEILIHGTNKPVSVGWPVSHGCIHLFPEDIKELFYLVPNGTEVHVVNQPYVFGWKNGRLYMAAYGPLKGDKRPWKRDWRHLLSTLITHADRMALRKHHQRINWTRIGHLVASPRGVPVPVSGRHNERLMQVLADARRVQNRIPAGSSWNGKTYLPDTNAQFRKFYAGVLTPQQQKALAAIDSLSHAAAKHVTSHHAARHTAGGSGRRIPTKR